MLIIGIILLAISGVLYYTRQKSLDKAMDIKYYETSKIVDIVSIYQEIKNELGAGNYYGKIMEVKGTGNADNPLIAEHSQRPVLYYEASVVREYEITQEKEDEDGNYRTVTERRSETVSNNTQYIPFYLDDGSGAQILINMKGAKKDLVQSFDKFEPQAPAGLNISFSTTGSKTIGYRYKERIIPAEASLYVLGEVSDKDGELSIVKPSESGKPFIVSTKSEQELVQSAESSAKWLTVGSIASAITGLGLIIGSFF